MTTDPQSPAALLKRVDNYLSALHGSVARHDNLAANFGCAGCELRDQIDALLAAPPAVPEAAPPTGQTDEECARHVARAIFALKTPSPDGSQHYQSGWDDGLEAAMDAAGDAVLSVLPVPVDRSAEERAARHLAAKDHPRTAWASLTVACRKAYLADARGVLEAAQLAVDQAAETPGPETQDAPDEWCKCRSCWGWFVEEHPGEDLDELGKDLDWWSGLPEHRDAPAGVSRPETVHACPPDGSGLTPCCGRTPFELPLGDRISSEAPVTCTGAPAVVAEPGKENGRG